jgi:prepilin-type N-terminal cleavage/methylation domain-containing protein
MRTIRSDTRGFTIIELLVSILVAVVLIGALNVTTINHSRISQRGRDLTLSNSYAENKIEELRSRGYLDLSNGNTDVTNELPSELKAPRTGTLAITEPSAGLKNVVLTITYNDQGAVRTQIYTTYVGELGVGQY